MQWVRDYEPRPAEGKLYTRAITITIVGNALLAGIKAYTAWVSGSVAIYADAANSISDVLYSLLMALGLYVAQRPPDISHPQGHSRFEPLVGLVVSLSMGFAGYEAISMSIERFQLGGIAVEPGLPTLVLLFSAATKAAMFISIRNIARKLTSPALDTSSKDNLNDVLTSLAAFVGAVGSKFISPLMDPIAGILVALWIFRAAIGAIRENLKFLTGGGASEELRKEIIQAVETIPGVIRVHHLVTDYAGPRLVADMHVNVSGETPLRDAHKITDDIIAKVSEFPEIDRVYVHLEPEDWE